MSLTQNYGFTNESDFLGLLDLFIEVELNFELKKIWPEKFREFIDSGLSFQAWIRKCMENDAGFLRTLWAKIWPYNDYPFIYNKISISKWAHLFFDHPIRCFVCLDRLAKCHLTPCGHMKTCIECYAALLKSGCPRCNGRVVGFHFYP